MEYGVFLLERVIIIFVVVKVVFEVLIVFVIYIGFFGVNVILKVGLGIGV